MAEDGRPRVTLIAKADKAEKTIVVEPRDGRLRPAPARVTRPTGEAVARARKTSAPSTKATASASTVPSATSVKARLPMKRPAPADTNGAVKRPAGVNALKVGVAVRPPKPPAVPTTLKAGDPDVVVTSVMKPPAPPSKAEVPPVSAPLSAALFNVGGQTFQVAAKLIRSKSDTLPAKLLAKAADPTKPLHIPVDICPERFRILLDWYRYGEIWVSNTVTTKAVLRDAARLDFPGEIVVNGVLCSLHQLDANQVGRSLLTGVINRWQGFQAFFTSILNQIDEHFKSIASQSASSVEAKDDEAACAEEAFDFPRFVVPLFREEGWVSPICSASRARVLALKLEELGYLCEFSETDLLVSLPLKLRCELHGAGPPHDQPEAQEVKDSLGAVPGVVKNPYVPKSGA
eukprot:Skav201673  [mRNA]  locus=scaffold641:359441:360649:+ [translate_table: standard]